MRKSMFSTKTLTKIAILVAMSIVLKSFLSLETQVFRVTFYDIPLIILGVMVGPIAGIIGGFAVDFMHVMFSPFAFTFNLFTVSAIMWGFIPGIFLFKRNFRVSTLVIIIAFTSIIAFSLNTAQLYLWYGSGSVIGALPMRLITMVIKIPIQVILIKNVLERLYEQQDVLTEKEVYGK